MSFGLNRAEVIGRLGADVTINSLASGGRVANMSIATDESYIDRRAGGERIDKTEWHRVVTFQDGLIDMLAKHAKKGRLIYVSGKMQTRKWRKDGEDSDRFSTEILLVPGGRVQLLDKPAGTNGNGAAPSNGDDAAPASADAQGTHIHSEPVPAAGILPAARPGAVSRVISRAGHGPVPFQPWHAAGALRAPPRAVRPWEVLPCPATASSPTTSPSAHAATTNGSSPQTARASAPS